MTEVPVYCLWLVKEMNFDLVIAHRVCSALSATAIGFKSKREMVEACAASMATALKDGIDYRGHGCCVG